MRTPRILAELARDDLKASLERLHALGWRLTTAGGDTVDRLALVHLTTGERLPVWTAPVVVPDRERATNAPVAVPFIDEAWPLCSAVGCRKSVAGQVNGDSFCADHLARLGAGGAVVCADIGAEEVPC